jgi:hypothetical protein
MENYGRRKELRNKVHEIFGEGHNTEECFYKYAMVWMSRKCNSKCKYCYQDGDTVNNAWSYEKADAVTSLLLAEGYHVQPLINEWLPEFWDFLKIMKKCQWKEITTNGLVIIDRYKEFFPLLKENGITDIRHSLFPKGIHEKITGRNREKTLKAIRLSKEHGFRVVVNYVVTTETLPHIMEVCEELLELEIDEVQFMNLIYLGRAKDLQKQLLKTDDLRAFWGIWKTLNEDERFKNIEFDFQANFGPCPQGNHVSTKAAEKDHFCIAGKNSYGHFLYITPEDGIYPCFLLSEPQFKIGEVICKNNTYQLDYSNSQDWEKAVGSFSRKNCAATQFLMKTILSNQEE